MSALRHRLIAVSLLALLCVLYFGPCAVWAQTTIAPGVAPGEEKVDKENCPCAADRSLTFAQRLSGEDVIIFLEHVHLEDATVTVTFELTNMAASHPSPYTVDLKTLGRNEGSELVRFVRLEKDKPYKWTWKTRYCYGNLGGKPDADYVYVLPYEHEKHEVVQTYFGNFSHKRGSESEYAVDFAMPSGTTVRAMRAGRVVALRQDSQAGGPKATFRPCENYVVLRHADGSYGMYAHLQKNGALVGLGDVVAAGRPIALSGSTGFSSSPHLHFDVFTPVDGTRIKTFPFKCQVGDESLGELKAHQSY